MKAAYLFDGEIVVGNVPTPHQGPGQLAGCSSRMIVGLGRGGRIVMGGCLQPEEVMVPPAQDRKLKVYFASGEEPQDMALALASIADGTIDVQPWLGQVRGLDALAQAIETMSDPASPIRTLIDPR